MTASTLDLEKRAADERKNLSRRLAACAQEAFARTELVRKTFRINGRNFALRVAGEILASNLTRALAHLATADTTEVELTIDCWDTASTGVAWPRPQWPAVFFMGRGDIRGLDTPEMRIAYFEWLDLLNVYFPEKGQAYYCLESADPFSIQQFGSPALTIFGWWFHQLGWQFTHAAAVGTDRGGVLVVGHGGAGKSTLAFSTLGTPLRYLSDDYCVLVPGSPPQALALYNSGKLTESSLGFLPHLRNCAANQHDSEREKAILFLHEQFPGTQLLQTPLRAMVLSDLHAEETSLTPLAPREILSIVGDSTLRQLAGSGNLDFMRFMRLARSLPTYRLRHGSDRTTAHQLLLQLCGS